MAYNVDNQTYMHKHLVCGIIVIYTFVRYIHAFVHILATHATLSKLKSSQVGRTQCKFHGLNQTMDTVIDTSLSDFYFCA